MCILQSLFFCSTRYPANGQYFVAVKQFIQEQERQGHQVRLPKLSENFIAVKEKDKLIVRLHDMSTLQIVR